MRVVTNLRRIRQGMGFSYAELARRLAKIGHPILDTGLLKIEKGERRVDVDDLVALAIALDTTPNRLMLPTIEIEHADDQYQVTPAVVGSAPLLWEWATGEVPLGYPPATIADDRDARDAEVKFLRENRPHHQRDWPWPALKPPPAEVPDHSADFYAITTAIISGFRDGIGTDQLRRAAEAALIAGLATPDASENRVRIVPTEDGRAAVLLLDPETPTKDDS